LNVGAALPGTGRHAAITIRRTSNLDEDALTAWQDAIQRGELLDKGDLIEPHADASKTAGESDSSEEGVSPSGPASAAEDAKLQAFLQGNISAR